MSAAPSSMIERACEHCGAMLCDYPSRIGRFCTRKCQGEARTAQAAEVRTDPMTCTSCDVEKPLAEFKRRSRQCRGCRGEQFRGERGRARNLRRNFGMTTAEWDALLASQDGKCAICSKPVDAGNAHTDHDHETGAVRGILCGVCNRGLGLFRDDPALLLRASEYVKR